MTVPLAMLRQRQEYARTLWLHSGNLPLRNITDAAGALLA
jgi:hypothetical protein